MPLDDMAEQVLSVGRCYPGRRTPCQQRHAVILICPYTTFILACIHLLYVRLGYIHCHHHYRLLVETVQCWTSHVSFCSL